MGTARRDRNEGRRYSGEREFDERYRQRYSGEDRDRLGGWRDEDRDRDSHVSDNMYREQTGYRDRDMYGREYGRESTGYGREQHGSGPQRGSWGTGGGLTGGHRGKGPAGYTRSDERIREDVSDRLTEDDEVDASNIEVQVKNGEVTLTGTAPDRRMKRAAEDCIERVSGVKDVINHIRVQDREREAQSGTQMGHKAESVSNAPERDTDNGKRPRA